jgi:protein arginine kinase activator
MADRPLECTECKRVIAYDYTEIIGDQIIRLSMCSECPILHKKLHGTTPYPAQAAALSGQKAGQKAGLGCGNCDTTLEAVQTGSSLGCSECYTIFNDVISYELISEKKISKRLGTPSKSTPLHVGRSCGEVVEISPEIQLVALDEALAETLKSEDYEGAAWLRDQIKSIKEQLNKRSEDGTS